VTASHWPSTTLAERVTGSPRLAHPALVWNLAIGQSTVATHHVKANLFYRGLAFHRMPHLGDTLTTTTTVVGLRENQGKEGRRPTGLVALRIRTRDQDNRRVLDFHRCAMLPLSGDDETGYRDDLTTVGVGWELPDLAPLAAGWDATHLAAAPLPNVGDEIDVIGGDAVTSAPELARLTLNVAQVCWVGTAVSRTAASSSSEPARLGVEVSPLASPARQVVCATRRGLPHQHRVR